MRRTLPILLAIFTILASYFVFGLFFEGAEKFGAATLYGQICVPPNFDNWFFDPWLFHVPLLAVMSTYFDGWPILGFWHILIQLTYLSLWFHIVIRALSRNENIGIYSLIPISILLIVSLLGTSLIYFYNIRDAILLTGVSMLLYADYYFYDNAKSKILIGLFLLGCLMRFPAALFTTLIISFLYFCLLPKAKQLFRLFLTHWIIIFLLLFLTQGYKYINDNPALKIEQGYEYAFTDRGAILPISVMKSAEDSVRYTALCKFFLISDTAQLGISFMDKVVDKSKFLNWTITKSDVQHFAKTTLPLIESEKTPLLLYILMLGIGAINVKSRVKYSVFFFVLAALSIFLLLGMKLSMYPYFLLPWISIVVGGALYMFYIDSSWMKWQKHAILFTLLLLFSLQFYLFRNISKTESDYNIAAEISLKKIETIAIKHTPILWDFEHSYLPTNLLSRKKSNVIKSCIFQSMYFLTYYRFGQERCIQKLGYSPLDWKTMNTRLQSKKNDVCFVMGEELAVFLNTYYATLYGASFVLEKSEPMLEIIPGNFVYHLR